MGEIGWASHQSLSCVAGKAGISDICHSAPFCRVSEPPAGSRPFPEQCYNAHTSCLQGCARKAHTAASRPSWAVASVTLSVLLLGCTEIHIADQRKHFRCVAQRHEASLYCKDLKLCQQLLLSKFRKGHIPSLLYTTLQRQPCQ